MNNKIIVGNVYRPPRESNSEKSFEKFGLAIEPLISKLSKKNNPTLIAGDFNMNLLRIHESEQTSNIFGQFCTHGFFPKITLPTRLCTRYRSASLIDQIYVKNNHGNISSSSSGIWLKKISDHKLTFAELDTFVPKQKVPDFILRKNVTEKSIALLRSDLTIAFANFNPIFHIEKNPELSLQLLEDTLKTYKDKRMPEVKMKFNRKKHTVQEYMTKDLMDGIYHRDRLYRKIEKLRDKNSPHGQALIAEHKAFAENLRKAIRAAKRDFYHKKFDQMKDSFKNTWKSINFILNRTKKKSEFPLSFLVNGQTITDKLEIAEKMNEFFTGIGPSLASEIDVTNKPDFTHFLAEPSSSQFFIEYTDAEKVTDIINSLASKDSQGIDGISTKFLKLFANQLSRPLSFIINQSLYSGIFPTRLKIAKVVPIYKENDEPENLFQNYRPISILTAISKVFEKVMNLQLTAYLNVNGKFTPNQYGFRKNHSTELAAIEFVDRVSQSMIKDENPFSIFIDLSKAFDTLDHKILLHKLEHLGIKGNKLEWFKNYLTGRFQYVDIDGVQSKTLPITTGVPQGSILGPTLFLIYINDINTASNFLNFICYADDTTLEADLASAKRQCGSSDIADISHFINNELEKVTNWLDVNMLSLNAGKTKLMVFRKNGSTLQPNKTPTIIIKGKNISIVPEFNFLGFLISEDLTWKKHHTKVATKVNKVNGVLTRLRYCLPRHTLKNIYNSLVLPHFQYGITLWGAECGTLEKLQKQCIRKINKAKKFNAHTDRLFRKSNLLKLSDIHKLFSLKFYYRYVQKELSPFFTDDIFPKNSAFHRYATSSANEYYVLSHHSSQVKPTIRYQVPSILQTIPDELLSRIETHSINTYSKHIKLFFTNEYNENCPIGPPNCYVCRIK